MNNNSPSDGSAAEVPNQPVEDILDVSDIQGNILAGFNKDFQRFLFLRIQDRAIVKSWLKMVTPTISTVAEVHSFNNLFRDMRARRGREARGLIATWMNIAFTSNGVRALTSPEEVEKFSDAPFRIGMHERAGLLGDPLDANGNPLNWVIGNPPNAPDVILIIASDDVAELQAKVERVKEAIKALPPASTPAGGPALEIIYEQAGQTRSDKPGHEHFGFKDGISQPGPRGRTSTELHSFLTRRLIDPQDQRAQRFAKPGQPLIWPGQFVLGYQTQDRHDPIKPAAPNPASPAWTRNGSYLVVRRLTQDVPRFWRFMEEKAAEIAQKPGFAGMSAERLANLITGRWQSGAPLMRAPLADNLLLATDNFANNHFNYVNDTAAITLIPGAGHQADTFPQALGDNVGVVCPHAAHIRKVNPRDMSTDIGSENETLKKLILRRGITFGTSILDPLRPTANELAEERGLMFLAYQASIKDQFEFLSGHWANSQNQPQEGGHDPIIGQNSNDPNRLRSVTLTAPSGETVDVSIEVEWVISTGGDYFFAPSISALTTVLSS